MKKFITLIAKAILVMLAFALSLWVFGARSYDGPGVWLAALAMIGFASNSAHSKQAGYNSSNSKNALMPMPQSLPPMARPISQLVFAKDIRNNNHKTSLTLMAEGEGFEPSDSLTHRTISNRVP